MPHVAATPVPSDVGSRAAYRDESPQRRALQRQL